jgi:hypothetical protein
VWSLGDFAAAAATNLKAAPAVAGCNFNPKPSDQIYEQNFLLPSAENQRIMRLFHTIAQGVSRLFFSLDELCLCYLIL